MNDHLRQVDPSQVSGAHFIYMAADRRSYDIVGKALEGRFFEGTLVRYGVVVAPRDNPTDERAKVFGLGRKWLAAMTEGDDPLRRPSLLYWWTALRRFAIEQAMNDLDRSGFTDDQFIVSIGMADTLRASAFRVCDLQQSDARGNLSCTADAGTDTTTTLADCEQCGVPDRWSLCRYVTRVSTRGVTADQGWIGRRLLGAVCQISKQPSKGVPRGCCRGYDEPVCFEPRVIESPGLREIATDAQVEDLLSALNVEWEKAHGFKLFDLVSFEPLKCLRGDCSDSANYYSRVMGLAELMAKLNEPAMRARLPKGVGNAINRGHTLAVLKAYVQQSGCPHGTEAVDAMRRVQHLRNLPPTHPPDQGGSRAIEELRRLGFSYPVEIGKWSQVWQVTRSTFAQALQLLRDDLQSAQPRRQ